MNMSKYILYILVFFIIYFTNDSIIFNEEILLFFSLIFMFCTLYFFFSSAVWTFINSEIKDIRSSILEAFEQQISNCNEKIDLLKSCIYNFYVPFFFSFWSFLVNEFVVSTISARLEVQVENYYRDMLLTFFKKYTKIFPIRLKRQINFVSTYILFFSIYSSLRGSLESRNSKIVKGGGMIAEYKIPKQIRRKSSAQDDFYITWEKLKIVENIRCSLFAFGSCYTIRSPFYFFFLLLNCFYINENIREKKVFSSKTY